MIEPNTEHARASRYPEELAEAEANALWQLYKTITTHRAEMERSQLIIGAGLVTIRDLGTWRYLGHESFASFLADPEVNISRSAADRLMRSYTAWGPHVEAGTVSADDLAAIGVYKANELAGVVAGADAETVREYAAAAQTQGYADTRRAVKVSQGWSAGQVWIDHLAGTVASVAAGLRRAATASDRTGARAELERLRDAVSTAIRRLESGDYADGD